MHVAADLQDEREIILFAYRTSDTDELNVWKEDDGTLMERFSVCLLSPPMVLTCVSPGTLRMVLLPFGWMEIAVHYRSIEKVIEFVQVGLFYLGDFDMDQSFVGEIKDVY
ncbi:hypothetical protein M9458_047470, partial [Cirrhinus mrigala]